MSLVKAQFGGVGGIPLGEKLLGEYMRDAGYATHVRTRSVENATNSMRDRYELLPTSVVLLTKSLSASGLSCRTACWKMGTNADATGRLELTHIPHTDPMLSCYRHLLFC